MMRYISDEEAVEYGYRKGLLKPGKGDAELVGFAIARGWITKPAPEEQLTESQINTIKTQKSREKVKSNDDQTRPDAAPRP